MRVTKQARQKTRDQLMEVGRELFTRSSWEEVTTRRIAVQAGIATGTLFNYFSTKEELFATVLATAWKKGEERFVNRPGTMGEGAASRIFGLVSDVFREILPFRRLIAGQTEQGFDPLLYNAKPFSELKTDHFQIVFAILTAQDICEDRINASREIYWVLMRGAFSAWSLDESPGLEDSRALLDTCVRLFLDTLSLPPIQGETP